MNNSKNLFQGYKKALPNDKPLCFSLTLQYESDEEKPGIILDFNEAGNIIGIEVLNASQKTNQPNGIIYEVA